MNKKVLAEIRRARARRAHAYTQAKRRRIIPNYGMKPKKSAFKAPWKYGFGIGKKRVKFA